MPIGTILQRDEPTKPGSEYEAGSYWRSLVTGEEDLAEARADLGVSWAGHVVEDDVSRAVEAAKPATVGDQESWRRSYTGGRYSLPGFYAQNQPKDFGNQTFREWVTEQFALKAAGGTVSGT